MEATVFTRLLLAIVFISVVSGCATTQPKPSDQLSNRVIELEKKLEEKDSEIVDLQYEVKDLHSKVENNKGVPSLSDDAAIASTPGEKTGDDKVIKVNVSATKVQMALKNAGYYTGKVDGKAGSGTKAAIAAFQKAQGLAADGVVGRKTWDALKQHLK